MIIEGVVDKMHVHEALCLRETEVAEAVANGTCVRELERTNRKERVL